MKNARAGNVQIILLVILLVIFIIVFRKINQTIDMNIQDSGQSGILHPTQEAPSASRQGSTLEDSTSSMDVSGEQKTETKTFEALPEKAKKQVVKPQYEAPLDDTMLVQ